MKEGWNVSIEHVAYMGMVNLYIAKKEAGQIAIAEPLDLTLRLVEEGHSVKPTLQLKEWEAHELLLALAEALDEKGMKTSKDAKMEGTLEATRYHLEDLRKMLKIDDN